MNHEHLIEIWADGACKGNPGPGGWGALVRSGGHTTELYGGEKLTTNNRMELTAVIRALEFFQHQQPITATIYTDSQYVQKGISEWIYNWKRRDWKTADKKPVKNADLWQQLDKLALQHALKWHWVKGHAGNVGNERADQLANLGIPQNQPTT